MRMPAFTAEISLNVMSSNFRTIGSRGSTRGKSGVVPQLPIAPGCGECTDLTWPDGTRTGACARSCCNGFRCWTETCPCGSGIYGWGWWNPTFLA
jgi:hypothetical protein